LSFRGATYSGTFTLLPMLTGRGQAHKAVEDGTAASKIVIGIAE
jgi:hypothetical protein